MSRVLEALSCGQVLVVAPPGAGKTTLLTQVAAATGHPVGWYSAGPEDAEAAVIVQYLARALWRDTSPPLSTSATIDDLLSAVGEGQQFPELVLVIDDLHELTDTPAEQALGRFLEYRPAHLRVLLGSRRPPKFNAPRMMASGTLIQFDGDDLRFRSWEVEELFRDLYREPLSPEASALLTRRVGGFAAALQLFHLSVRGRSRSDRETQIRQLSGRSPFIRAYLTQTVLDSLSPEHRDFLIRTSVFEVLRSDLCDALLQRTDSAAILRALTQDQLFTTSPDGGLTFVYHQVLHSHLEVTLADELPAAEIRTLRLRAATLLEEVGDTAAALRIYDRMGDRPAADRLLRQRGVRSPAGNAIGNSLGTVPTHATADPWLFLAQVLAGDYTVASTVTQRAASAPEGEAWARFGPDLVAVLLDLAEPDGAPRAIARLDELVPATTRAGYPWFARVASGLQSCVLLEWTGELDRQDRCTAIIAGCEADGDRWGALIVRLFAAITLTRLGQDAAARPIFEDAESLCQELDAPVFGQWVQNYRTTLNLNLNMRLRVLERVAARGHLHCLGGFRLARGSEVTELTELRPRARLLVLRLAMSHGQDVHREHLIDALWPEATLSQGLRRLQVAVSSARQLLAQHGWGTDCLARSGDTYRLHLPVTVDLNHLEETLNAIAHPPAPPDPVWIERLTEEVTTCYRGELLPEVGPAEWVLPERERLRLTTASALVVLSQHALSLDRADLALSPAQRVVELDPYRDTAWLSLARIQRQLGDHTAAAATMSAYHRVSAQVRA